MLGPGKAPGGKWQDDQRGGGTKLRANLYFLSSASSIGLTLLM